VATRTSRHRSYFPTEFDPTLERGDSAERRRAKVEGDCVDELKSILGQNLADLTDVEQTVIRARFALEARAADADVPRVKTLEQVGEMIGVTKERVRQIQNKALAKLRTALDQGLLSA
jgi:RNA polymerase sigma factor (sigma-70 family)